MEISELDKLQRDLEDLIMARRKMDEVRKGLSIAKRSTALWIYIRTSRLIMEIDHRIGMKRGEIAQEEARDGYRRVCREENTAGDRAVAVDVCGRAETDVLEERERAGSAAGAGGELGNVEPVPDVAAGEGTGSREYARAGGSAEECLRRRYQERNGLRDWQKAVMEADRAGRHERLVL